MTKEEAIENLKDILAEATETDDSVCYVTSDDEDALKVVIQALEQEPVLDKIRAEIEETYMNITYQENKGKKATWGLRKALEIIDKYTAESENKE